MSLGALIRSLPVVAMLAGCAMKADPPPAAPPAPDPALVRVAIDSQLARLSAAYKARDAAAFAAIYTSDGVSASPQGTATGRPAIAAAMQKAFDQLITASDDSVVTEDFILSGDRAIQSGHVSWTETVKGKKPGRTRLDFVFQWRKDVDGVWRVARDLNFAGSVK